MFIKNLTSLLIIITAFIESISFILATMTPIKAICGIPIINISVTALIAVLIIGFLSAILD
jgi:hypothetical protein